MIRVDKRRIRCQKWQEWDRTWSHVMQVLAADPLTCITKGMHQHNVSFVLLIPFSVDPYEP
jgi:hypothetical protein